TGVCKPTRGSPSSAANGLNNDSSGTSEAVSTTCPIRSRSPSSSARTLILASASRLAASSALPPTATNGSLASKSALSGQTDRLPGRRARADQGSPSAGTSEKVASTAAPSGTSSSQLRAETGSLNTTSSSSG